MRKLAQNYFSVLILEGWDTRYLLDTVNERFFSADIAKIEKRTFARFFLSSTTSKRPSRYTSHATNGRTDISRSFDFLQLRPLAEAIYLEIYLAASLPTLRRQPIFF